MKIIVLNGKANCGKTTVLKKLYAKMVVDCRFLQTDFKKESPFDLSAMFELGTKKIGITTLGDSETELEKAFSVFIKENCDLVVCASRSRDAKNGAVHYIKSLGADLVWYKKAYLEQSGALYNLGKEINGINDIQADILLQEIFLQI